jgi:thiol-disulfide isomerase/thioredoxin
VAPPPSASVSAAPAAPKVPRKLCDAETAPGSKTGRALPKGTFDTAAASGAALPDGKLDVGGGRWTWINFFAAWCIPCKEEIPRLKTWEQKLATSLRVRFISLDDDDRQLGRFLEQQPPTGVRASLWLKPGNHRDSFLEGLKLKSSPSLPAHALVDPQGRVRCAFEGAVDDSDYGQIETIVARRP